MSTTASMAQQDRAAELSRMTKKQLIDRVLRLEAAAASQQSVPATHYPSPIPPTSVDITDPNAPSAPSRKRPHSAEHKQPAELPAAAAATNSLQPALDISASPNSTTSSSPLPSPPSPTPPPTKHQRLSTPPTTTTTTTNPGFDYWSHPIRHIAFRFLYLGTPFHGFSTQASPTHTHNTHTTTTVPTVESHLFHALTASRLIASRASCHYQRCGRTDRGVHAGGQVISLWVRSRLRGVVEGGGGRVPVGWVGEGKKRREREREERRARGEVILIRHLEDARDSSSSSDDHDDDDEKDSSKQRRSTRSDDDDDADDDEKEEEEKGEQTQHNSTDNNKHTTAHTIEVDSADFEKDEFEYPAMLNRHLPPTIRILSYHPVPLPFSARFSCHTRTYHYLFYRDTLDVAAMREAGALMVGKSDWRNFCTYDVTSVSHFVRRIHRVDVLPEGESAEEAVVEGGGEVGEVRRRNGLWRVEVEGKGFLYHQVRCMVSILFAIGRHEEPITLVHTLLDTALTPHKPAYRMASERGLILQHARYDEVSDSASGYPTAAISAVNLTRCYTALWQQQRQLAMEAAVLAHMAASIHRSLLSLSLGSGSGGGGGGLCLLGQLPFQLDDRVNKRWLCGGGELLRAANLQRSFEEKVGSLTGKRKERRQKVERMREVWKRKDGADTDSGGSGGGGSVSGEGGGDGNVNRMDVTAEAVSDSNGQTVK